jgi:hypothetical protein
MFDPSQFLDTQLTETNDTKVTPVPEGEYTAVVKEITSRTWSSKSDPTKSGVTLDLIWSLDDSNVRQLLGRDEVTVKQGVMLDLTDAGGLDMGKGRNVGLGRLREAFDLNKPGVPFSPSMFAGRVAKVSVKHRIVDENIYAEVKAVAKS